MMHIGFGDNNFSFAVYIASKPNMAEYQALYTVEALSLGEINVINLACGNGWRKVFNVYAKLIYTLNRQSFEYSAKAPTWQEYRDKHLLQANSKTALLFSNPILLGAETASLNNDTVHIICGKGYAKSLINKGQLNVNLVWLDDEFAIDTHHNLIVCPYFDYRQLSNIKIERLSKLLLSLKSGFSKREI